MRFLPVLLLLAVTAVPMVAAPGDETVGDRYLALVIRYQSGEHDVVTRTLSEWSAIDLDTAVRAFPAALKKASPKHGLRRSVLIATAMVVHLDAVGRAERTGDLDRHLAAGQRLADLLPLDDLEESATGFRARWYHAAGTAMQRLSKYDDALQLFEMAERLRPRDPGILLALGSVHEIEGTLALDTDVKAKQAPAGSSSRKPTQRSIDEHLVTAADCYRTAIDVAPDLYEARLRLARTLYLQGRLDAADAAAKMLDARAPDDYLRYLTLLIGGSISEAAGRLDEAIARYRDAGALCRGCHSATLALSQVLLRKGDRDVARDLVNRLVNIPLWPVPVDPWLDYRIGQWWRFDAIFEELQREMPE